MEYKAILYYTKFYDSESTIINHHHSDGTEPITRPVDVTYLTGENYKDAEEYFFELREWKQDGNFHIEFEEVED